MEPGKEGTPNESLREPWVEQGREEEKWKKSTLKYSYPECRVENRKSDTKQRRPTSIRSLGRDTLGCGGLSSPDEGYPLDGGLAGSNSSVEDFAYSTPHP
jgi:hypothetical protein